MGARLVLVAEDNEINRLVARAMLLKEGIESAAAHDGAQAVEMALAGDFAAILMDCQMPGLDGYEATRRIRADERRGGVPIIAMTAHSLPADRDRCLAAGMDDYISKPVSRQRLREVISRWLPVGAQDIAAAPATPSATGEPLSPQPAEVPVLDGARIARLREEHPPEMRLRLIEAFELALPAAIDEILGAAQQGDAAGCKRAAHRLRGSSLMLGAVRLSIACQKIENSGQPHGVAGESGGAGRLRALAQEARVSLRLQLS